MKKTNQDAAEDDTKDDDEGIMGWFWKYVQRFLDPQSLYVPDFVL